MLQSLRRQAQSPIIQGVVIIIAIVFIFWGVGTNLLKGSSHSAITINDEQIGFEEYQRAYERLHENVAARFGGNLSKEMADSLHVKEQAIGQLIQSALLQQGAKAIGLEVSGKEIQEAVAAMPQFQDGGSFSLAKYNTLLTANRLTPNKFENGLRHDFLREKAVQEIGSFVMYVSDREVDDLLQYGNQRVTLSLLRFTPASYRDQIKIDDKALAAWYEDEKDAFKTPPEMKIRYLAYRYADLAKTIALGDERIRQYYEEHADEFARPEMRRPRILFLRTDAANVAAKMKEAEAMRARALAGEDFTALARQYSEDSSKNNGGDLGLLPKVSAAGASNQMVDLLFSLKPGDISPAVSVQDGVFLMQLAEIQAARQQTFDEAKVKIASQLQQKEAESVAFARANAAYEGIIGDGSIQAYLQKHPEEHLQTTGFFRENQPPVDFPQDQELLTKVFALNSGELSSLLKAPDGCFIVFADEKKAPVVPSLAAVHLEAEKRYVEAKAQKIAAEKAKEALAALRGGKSMAEVARGVGLTVEQSPFVSRRQWPPEMPPEMMKTVFILTDKSPYPTAPAAKGDEQLVYMFKERQNTDTAGHEAERAQLRESLLQFKRGQILGAFLDQEQMGAKIHRNPNL
ncbi:MAG: SurA N-terminal domain-containing protein [Desulfobulbaceae bacterium]|jgi:peptidyl-prolyl cis-trans isomerase D|nr:SurA N-terminal domain-containing protein [Desulfobulbaceae bacterium]